MNNKKLKYDEVMKDFFIPEYYEYIKQGDTSWEFGKIYKPDENGIINFESGRKSTFSYINNTTIFKTSTKEAYDAQFVVEKKIIEPLPQFKIIESIETITKVENNEGNQFFIGDKITTPLNNIIRIISSFTYNQDKTELYANFEETIDVVSINKIEHYIEPKAVEPEFVLPEKWSIKSKARKHDKILNGYARSVGATWWSNTSNFTRIFYMLINNNIYKNSSDNNPNDYTELTFDQFEKYVLNN